MARLRDTVALTAQGSGVELHDRMTGLKLQLEMSAAELQSDAPRDDDLWDQLSELGLTDAPLTVEEVFRRQHAHRQEGLEQGRLERLRALLAFSVARVPYYRERRAAYAPERIGSLGDLELLPLMRKADLRAGFPDTLVAEGVDIAKGLEDGSLTFSTTSGTTGERLQVISDTRLPTLPDHFDALWGLKLVAGKTPMTAVFTSPMCLGMQCHLGQRTYDERMVAGTTLFLNSTDDLFTLDRALLENIAAELARLQPTFFVANPVYLQWLGRVAREAGIALPKVPVILSSYQYVTQTARAALERDFGARVYDVYAASDLGGCRVAIECPQRRLHVREDQSMIELLEGSRSAPRGELGAVAVTTLASRVMPLVRYLVGDVGRWDDAPCDCGARDWPRLELHGRLKDVMRVGGRLVTTRHVDEAIGRADGVELWSCRQVSADELALELIPTLGGSPDVKGLAARLQEKLGARRVRVEVVRALEPEPSLKYRLTQGLQPPAEL